LRGGCHAAALANSAGDLDVLGFSGMELDRLRRAVLLEIDPAYADVIVWRWQEATGEAAVLEGENCNYNEIKLQRSL
jgi:hypothetical protein